jgi:hypothetical protein
MEEAARPGLAAGISFAGCAWRPGRACRIRLFEA